MAGSGTVYSITDDLVFMFLPYNFINYEYVNMLFDMFGY